MLTSHCLLHNVSACHTTHNIELPLPSQVFRCDFLDSAIDKCSECGTAAGILVHAVKVQRDLKSARKTAEEEAAAAEAAAAAKAAKKGKKKK